MMSFEMIADAAVPTTGIFAYFVVFLTFGVPAKLPLYDMAINKKTHTYSQICQQQQCHYLKSRPPPPEEFLQKMHLTGSCKWRI